MFFRIVLSVALMLVLSHCASTKASREATGIPLSWITYTCSNDRVVQAAYPDPKTAQLRIDGAVHTLHIAVSADGARYIGDGWQWWTRGRHDGSLAPLAAPETIASAPGMACHAP